MLEQKYPKTLLEDSMLRAKKALFALDFLNKYPRNGYEHTEIVTFDVISLYTSIPLEFGLEAIDYFLTKYQEDLHPRFRKEFVLESANFILKNNTLTFGSEFSL